MDTLYTLRKDDASSLWLYVCQMQFFFDFAKLADGDIELVTVITNAACIRYQLLGELPCAILINSLLSSDKFSVLFFWNPRCYDEGKRAKTKKEEEEGAHVIAAQRPCTERGCLPSLINTSPCP